MPNDRIKNKENYTTGNHIVNTEHYKSNAMKCLQFIQLQSFGSFAKTLPIYFWSASPACFINIKKQVFLWWRITHLNALQSRNHISVSYFFPTFPTKTCQKIIIQIEVSYLSNMYSHTLKKKTKKPKPKYNSSLKTSPKKKKNGQGYNSHFMTLCEVMCLITRKGPMESETKI